MKKVKVMTNTLFIAALFNLIICKKYLVELDESDELNVRMKKTNKSIFTGGELDDSDEVRNLRDFEQSNQTLGDRTEESTYLLMKQIFESKQRIN